MTTTTTTPKLSIMRKDPTIEFEDFSLNDTFYLIAIAATGCGAVVESDGVTIREFAGYDHAADTLDRIRNGYETATVVAHSVARFAR